MVLIIKKIIGKRCELVFIPQRSLNDMLERHVNRTRLAKDRENTCIVTSSDEWTGKPSDKIVIKLLLEILNKQKILQGEHRYAIPHHLFCNLKCRDFDGLGNPETPVFNGDFVVNLFRIKGKSKKAIKQIRAYEKIGLYESAKIKKTFEKMENSCENLLVFLAHHIHPARRTK